MTAHPRRSFTPIGHAQREEVGPHYVSVAARTDVGRVRRKNEDAFVVADLTGGSLLSDHSYGRFDVGERGVLLAVSDGMGGAHAGEVASALVLDTLTRELGDDGTPVETPRDSRLMEAIQHAHQAVRQRGKREHAAMGATLTAAYVRGGRAYIAEVGDSRAYLLRAGKLIQITHDQSMVQMLVDHGVMNAEDATRSPLRNVILQAMGHQPELEIAIARLDLRDRDCLILCSDGLTNQMTDDEIRDIVLASQRPQHAADALVELANARGGSDNITVIVAGIGGALARPSSPGDDPEHAIEVLNDYELKMPLH